MGRKCIPGVICIENMTLFIMFVILVLVIYMFVRFQKQSAPVVNNIYSGSGLASLATRSDPFNDPYSPPLKNDGLYLPIDSGDIRGGPSMIGVSQMGGRQPVGIPVNVQTRSYNPEYSQIGILTRSNGSDMILTLMGRRVMNGRDRYQYYTISNTGSVNTKLPIKVHGKSCTGEYGCDSINSGDTVYVEGYKDTFQATVYENSLLNYIPFL